MRPRRWSVLVLALLASGACASPSRDGFSGVAEPVRGRVGHSSTRPSAPIAPTASTTRPKTAAPRPPATKAPPNPGRERPSPRPMGPTMTGVVERDGSCTILVAGSKRWALMGAPAESLAVGAKVSVTTNAAAMPPGCAGRPELPAVLVLRATPA